MDCAVHSFLKYYLLYLTTPKQVTYLHLKPLLETRFGKTVFTRYKRVVQEMLQQYLEGHSLSPAKRYMKIKFMRGNPDAEPLPADLGAELLHDTFYCPIHTLRVILNENTEVPLRDYQVTVMKQMREQCWAGTGKFGDIYESEDECLWYLVKKQKYQVVARPTAEDAEVTDKLRLQFLRVCSEMGVDTIVPKFAMNAVIFQKQFRAHFKQFPFEHIQNNIYLLRRVLVLAMDKSDSQPCLPSPRLPPKAASASASPVAESPSAAGGAASAVKSAETCDELGASVTRLAAEIEHIQDTLDAAEKSIVGLEQNLQEQLEEEGEDLCDVDTSLKDAQERLSVLLAAGRGSSRKARRLAEAVDVLEQISSVRYKRDSALKTISSSRLLLQQKMIEHQAATEAWDAAKIAAEEEAATPPPPSPRKLTATAVWSAITVPPKLPAPAGDTFVSNRKRPQKPTGHPPYTEKDTQSVFGNEISCCCSSMQGMRPNQEDEHLMRACLPFAKHFSFFAVFDGHGGPATSKLCEAEFMNKLQAATDWNKGVFPNDMGNVLTKAYMDFDAWLKERPGTDHETTGSTALSALISPTHIVIANLGDCRAVLVRDGKVLVMSTDHKPKNKTEYQRIKAAGGGVFMGRVMGELAVARAFGDFSLKDSDDLPPEKQMVSCQPETRTIERSLKDDFLVLACDGVWDVMSNDECVEFISTALDGGKKLQFILNDLLDHCLKKRSRDNMTVMVVDFRPMLTPH